jgi:hypothetical protein
MGHSFWLDEQLNAACFSGLTLNETGFFRCYHHLVYGGCGHLKVAAHGGSKVLLEEGVWIWIVVETVNLAPAGVAVELLRLRQRAVGVKTKDIYEQLAGDAFRGRHQTPCKPKPPERRARPKVS